MPPRFLVDAAGVFDLSRVVAITLQDHPIKKGSATILRLEGGHSVLINMPYDAAVDAWREGLGDATPASGERSPSPEDESPPHS